MINLKNNIIKDLYHQSVLTQCIIEENIDGLLMEYIRIYSYPESYELEDNGYLDQHSQNALLDINIFLENGLDFNSNKILIAQQAYHFFSENINYDWNKILEAHLCFWSNLNHFWDFDIIQIEYNKFNYSLLNFIFIYNLKDVKKAVNINEEELKSKWEKYIDLSFLK